MRTVLRCIAAVVLLCALSAAPSFGQEKDGMHRLEIYNGGSRTVQYFGNDAAAARERSRKENDASIADLVHDLRVLYLRNERAMEIKRHQMQMLLYGYTTTYEVSLFPAGGYDSYLYGGWGWWGGFGGYPALLGTSTYGLQYGIGDEGALKNQLIQGLIPPQAEKKP
jgi:hypothetical protein